MYHRRKQSLGGFFFRWGFLYKIQKHLITGVATSIPKEAYRFTSIFTTVYELNQPKHKDDINSMQKALR